MIELQGKVRDVRFDVPGIAVVLLGKALCENRRESLQKGYGKQRQRRLQVPGQKEGEVGDKGGKTGEKAGVQAQGLPCHRVEVIVQQLHGLSMLHAVKGRKRTGEKAAGQQPPASVQRLRGGLAVPQAGGEIKGLGEGQQQEQDRAGPEHAFAVARNGPCHSAGQKPGVPQAYGDGYQFQDPGGDAHPAQDGGELPGSAAGVLPGCCRYGGSILFSIYRVHVGILSEFVHSLSISVLNRFLHEKSHRRSHP